MSNPQPMYAMERLHGQSSNISVGQLSVDAGNSTSTTPFIRLGIICNHLWNVNPPFRLVQGIGHPSSASTTPQHHGGRRMELQWTLDGIFGQLLSPMLVVFNLEASICNVLVQVDILLVVRVGQLLCLPLPLVGWVCNHSGWCG